MRRMFCLFATFFVAIAITLSGCNKPAEHADSTNSAPNPWTACTTTKSTVSPEEMELFNRAYAGVTDVSYTPVATLATQVVSGTNYAFLCTDNSMDGEHGWHIATIYAGFEGDPEVISEKSVQPTDLKTTDNLTSTEGMSGAWTIAAPAQHELEPTESATAFQAAAKEYADIALTPIATLAAQEDNGTNYLVLCAGKTGKDENYSLYVAEVHSDQNGDASMKSVRAFDLLAYV